MGIGRVGAGALGAPAIVQRGKQYPRVKKFTYSETSEPTMNFSTLEIAPGDRIVIACSNGTAATAITTATSGWSVVAGAGLNPTGSQYIGLFEWLADAYSKTITINNEAGLRAAWNIGQCDIDAANVNMSNGNATTTLDWETQASFPEACCLGYVIQSVTQTDLLTPLASAISAGLATRRVKTGAQGAWAGDTGSTRLSSFDPANGTFDTSCRWSGVIIPFRRREDF